MAYHDDALLILGLTPEFLEKPVLWFAQNRERILEQLKKPSPWQDRAILLSLGMRLPLPFLLRRLDELGYEKVLDVTTHGEFAHRGGIVDMFPINTEHPFRAEFAGNEINELLELRNVVSVLTREQLKKRLEKQREATEALLHLKPGDYIVHLDHGVGRYIGRSILRVSSADEPQEYFVIEYAASDKLYVPLALGRKLSLYIGFSEPHVHRLGGTLWLRTKRKAKEEALAFARELLALYARREIAMRAPYAPDDELQRAFEDAFSHEATPDQLHAIAEIKRDMEKSVPMDRVVCGDVGFGKTEVAMRAMLKAALSGRQTALLAPTTILADQHFLTFTERFRGFPVSLAVLTRLQTASEQRKTLERLKDGALDILIGTHRLLAKDVTFKNLGLLVIDEEQRFGVRQKEHLKNLRAELDVLSLSATPIPRTLSFALANLKPISRIQTPPPLRKNIATHIAPWNKKTVREAIAQELAQGGQVYVLHNRVITIRKFADGIQQLVPSARLGIIHGRAGEKTLVTTMRELREGTIDVLVATTIIENGLDIERVNTLIVEDAAKLGLAQAHQIRGRIGRGERQAHAYFFFRPPQLSEKAKKRLEALKEAEELGSGYRLALRDLEIRGAGNLLGKEQSGAVNRVGFNLYCQMLGEAVEQLK